jgi:hypothetical protein
MINASVDRGVFVQLLCFDNEKKRDIENLKINVTQKVIKKKRFI